MLAPALQSKTGSQPQRVRCRQIAQSDLSALAGLLAHGFPRTNHDYWAQGFARLQMLPPVEGQPRFGYVLESETGIVGVLLLISSQRPDGRIIANLSSWYVDPAWRAHSSLLVAVTAKQKHVTYLNASPAPHTWRTLQAQGFHPFNFGRSAAFPAFSLGSGHVRQEIPDDLPEKDLLLAHRALGCIALTCEKNGATSPFIFKPKKLERPKLNMMELIYCRSTQDFARCGAALGRYLLRRHGAWGVILDGKISSMPARYVAGKEPRYFKGPATKLNDLAFTEKVIFP